MFTVEKTEYINKTFRIPKKLIADLETLAQAKSVSLNRLVVECCKYAIDNLDKKDIDIPESLSAQK